MTRAIFASSRQNPVDSDKLKHHVAPLLGISGSLGCVQSIESSPFEMGKLDYAGNWITRTVNDCRRWIAIQTGSGRYLRIVLLINLRRVRLGLIR